MALTTIPVELVTLDDGVTISVTDNSDVLTLKSTDADENSGPRLALTRDSGSPADNDYIGLISFNADDDGGNVTRFGYMVGQIADASNSSEDGILQIHSTVGGTERNRINITSTETVFNEDSIDLDFRVESEDHAHMLFVDGGNNAVGIKNSDPHDTSWAADGANTAQLSIGNTSSGSSYGVLNLLGHNGQATKYSMGVGDGIFYMAYDDVAGVHRIKVTADGVVTIPLQPAFSALALGQSNMANGTQIHFDAETFDRNADYNHSTSVFTAPVDGTYNLSMNIRLVSVTADASYIIIRLVTSNVNYDWIIDPRPGDDTWDYLSPNINVVADLDASDTAYVYYYQSGGTFNNDIAADVGHFAGYLVG